MGLGDDSFIDTTNYRTEQSQSPSFPPRLAGMDQMQPLPYLHRRHRYR